MVQGTRKDGLVAEVFLRTHRLILDVTEHLGGQDQGPNPHEVLEAALSACTIITAQMYANRKKINLTSTHVVVEIVTEGAETVISRQVSFRGELTDEQRERLTEIVNKCPIHKLLQSQVTIQTTVVR